MNRDNHNWTHLHADRAEILRRAMDEAWGEDLPPLVPSAEPDGLGLGIVGLALLMLGAAGVLVLLCLGR